MVLIVFNLDNFLNKLERVLFFNFFAEQKSSEENIPRTSRRNKRNIEPFSCKECDRMFALKTDFKKHQRVHMGGKMFSCKQCSVSVADSEALKMHEQIHTGKNPSSFIQCNSIYRQFGSSKTYRRIHTCEKSFCEQRKASFVQSDKLIQQVHTSEKPYSCKQCDVRFAQSSGLKKHKQIHTGEKKRYSCIQCYAKFARSGCLRRHQQIHMGEYYCIQCNAVFTHISN